MRRTKKSKEEKPDKQGFLKKRPAKNKMVMKEISQLKMNAIFLGGFIGLIALSVATIFIAFTKTVQPVTVDKAETIVLPPKEEVDNRLQLFLDSYVQTYFTVSLDTEQQVKQKELLNGFYAYIPEVKHEPTIEKVRTLVSSRLQRVEDNLAVYRVTYEVGEEKQRVTVLFTIPYGGQDGKYYVSGLPYFQAVESFKTDDVSTINKLQLNATDDMSLEKREALTKFVDLFFTNYTTSQDNLDIVANNVRSINGAIYKGIDYVYFKEADKSIKAYVQASFEISGIVHVENFSLTLVDKEDSYFVEVLEHDIPFDYMK